MRWLLPLVIQLLLNFFKKSQKRPTLHCARFPPLLEERDFVFSEGHVLSFLQLPKAGQLADSFAAKGPPCLFWRRAHLGEAFGFGPVVVFFFGNKIFLVPTTSPPHPTFPERKTNVPTAFLFKLRITTISCTPSPIIHVKWG